MSFLYVTIHQRRISQFNKWCREVFSVHLIKFFCLWSLFTCLLFQGLLLLWMFNPYDVKWLVVVALVLLSLGTSGDNLLDDVLTDLVNDIDLVKDGDYLIKKKYSDELAAIWSRIAYIFGAISATLWVTTSPTGGVSQLSWSTSFFICIIGMFTALILFIIGCKLYHQDELIQRPIMSFFRVLGYGIKYLRNFIFR